MSTTQITYSPIKWRNNQDTALNAENLNSMDNGIVSAVDNINKLYRADNNINNRIDNLGVENLKDNASIEGYKGAHVVFTAGNASTYVPVKLDSNNETVVNVIHARNTQKVDTDANWEKSTFIPAPGEIVLGTGKQTIRVLEYDTNLREYKIVEKQEEGAFRFKIGDGIHTYPYLSELIGTQGPQGPQGKYQVINSVKVNQLSASSNAYAEVTHPDPTKTETDGEVYSALTLNLPRAYGTRLGSIANVMGPAGTSPNVSITSTDPGESNPDDYLLNFSFSLPQSPEINIASSHDVLEPTATPTVIDEVTNKYAPRFKFGIPRGYGARFTSFNVNAIEPNITATSSITNTKNTTDGTYDHTLTLNIPRGYDAKIGNITTVAKDPGTNPSVIAGTPTKNGTAYLTDLTFNLPKSPTIEVRSSQTNTYGNEIKVTNNGTNYAAKLNLELPKLNSITGIEKGTSTTSNGRTVTTYNVKLASGTIGNSFTVTDGKDGVNGNDGVGISSVTCNQNSTSGQYSTITIALTNGKSETFNVYNGADGTLYWTEF